jgi:hypothetical protein
MIWKSCLIPILTVVVVQSCGGFFDDAGGKFRCEMTRCSRLLRETALSGTGGSISMLHNILEKQHSSPSFEYSMQDLVFILTKFYLQLSSKYLHYPIR